MYQCVFFVRAVHDDSCFSEKFVVIASLMKSGSLFQVMTCFWWQRAILCRLLSGELFLLTFVALPFERFVFYRWLTELIDTCLSTSKYFLIVKFIFPICWKKCPQFIVKKNNKSDLLFVFRYQNVLAYLKNTVTHTFLKTFMKVLACTQVY